MHSKRIVQVFSFGAAMILLAFFYGVVTRNESPSTSHAGGLEETIIDTQTRVPTALSSRYKVDEQSPPQRSMKTSFHSETSSTTSTYSLVMVLPRMQDDDISWIAQELPQLNISVYVANNPRAPKHPPKNKGHEVMIYLSYLIDNYDHLPDIVLFMHSHRWTHHNNDYLGFDASQMIRALNGAHVMRQGYVNMRCHWSPGCPEWLRPSSSGDTLGKQEEAVLDRCWRELFPFDELPSFLAQPCCAQFALSNDRIRSIPRSRYVFYRDWILRTPLSDYVSGRIWEYSWQYLFTKNSAHCPQEHICYCDGFGICFGGDVPYRHYVELLDRKSNITDELSQDDRTPGIDGSAGLKMANSSLPNLGQNDAGRAHLKARITELEMELIALKKEAQHRGADPRLRAEECGRPWKEGDGF
ncbi:MAG: hypothetical protein Q9183_000270 [Haloplaca sp. 2 TL-2023]